MKKEHFTITHYITDMEMPLWVVPVALGRHRENQYHDHEESELVLVTHGPAVHEAEGERVEVTAGDVLIVHPGTVHAYDQTEQLELINIIYNAQSLSLPVLDGSRLSFFKRFFPPHQDVQVSCPHPELHLSAEAMEEILEKIKLLQKELREGQPGYNLYAMAIFIEIIVELCRLGEVPRMVPRMPFLMGEAISYVKRNFAEHFSLDLLAQKAYMSRRSFFMHFKRMTGDSPGSYILKLRIDHGKKLLLESSLPVGEIAVRCGFSDSNYFTRQFKALTGTSPRDFRKTGK